MKLNINIKKLQKKFKNLRSSYDMRGFADFMVEILQMHESLIKNQSDIPPEFMEFYQHIDAYSYVIVTELAKHNGKKALKYLNALLAISPNLANQMFHLYVMIGMANYEVGNYQKAEEAFKIYLSFRQQRWQDSDEIILFYLGNTFAYENNFPMAKAAYEQCLNMKKSFSDAAHNLSIINNIFTSGNLEGLSGLHRYIESSFLDVDENDEAACFNIPIFINARDRVGVMKKQIDWFLDAGYTNIIILDNNSTYPPLLEYYKSFQGDRRIRIIIFDQNLGFKSIWISGILEALNINTPYVYTDPDLVPIETCPKNFVQILLKILKKPQNIFVKKIGLGMPYKDITFFNKDYCIKTESNYYDGTDISKNLYYCQVDTTLALYVNCRHYNLRFSMRTTGDLMARHLPWYFDYDNLSEDEQYYLDHSDKQSSSTGVQFKEIKNN